MREAAEVGITHLGTPGPLGAPWWVVLPSGTFLAQQVSSGLEKIHKNFCYVWTPFDIDFLRCKKQAKNSNWHWVNRLVPKNDIKLL